MRIFCRSSIQKNVNNKTKLCIFFHCLLYFVFSVFTCLCRNKHVFFVSIRIVNIFRPCFLATAVFLARKAHLNCFCFSFFCIICFLSVSLCSGISQFVCIPSSTLRTYVCVLSLFLFCYSLYLFLVFPLVPFCVFAGLTNFYYVG